MFVSIDEVLNLTSFPPSPSLGEGGGIPPPVVGA